MAFTKYLNEFFGTLLILSALLSTVSAVDCHGKSFHCVNSTHFMICVDLGGGVSQSIDNFYISCPPPTVCHGTNHFECEFPASTTPSATLTNIISETSPPWVDVVTDTLPPGNTTKEFSEKYMNTESVTTAVDDSFTTVATVDYTTATTLDLYYNTELNTVDNLKKIQEIAKQTSHINNITDFDLIKTAQEFTTSATDIVTQNETKTIPVVDKLNASPVVELVTESIIDGVNITDIELTVITEVPTTLITQNIIETNNTTVKVYPILETSANIDSKNIIEVAKQTSHINNITDVDLIKTAQEFTTSATDIVTQNEIKTTPVVDKLNASSVVEMVTESIIDGVNITDTELTVITEVPTTLITQNIIETNNTTVKVYPILETSANIDSKNIIEVAKQTSHINNITDFDLIKTAQEFTTSATDIVTQNEIRTTPVVDKLNAGTVVEMVTESIIDGVNITDTELTVVTEVPTLITQNIIETNNNMVKVSPILQTSANIDSKNIIEVNPVPIAIETTAFTTEIIAQFATESTIPGKIEPKQPEDNPATTDKVFELQTVDLNTLRELSGGYTTEATEFTQINNINRTTIKKASIPNNVNETTTDIILQVVVPEKSTTISEPTLALPHIKVDPLNSVSVDTTTNYEAPGLSAVITSEGSITSEATFVTTELSYPDLAQNGASQFTISDNIPLQNTFTTEKYIEVEPTTIDESIYRHNTVSQMTSFNEAFLDHTTVNYMNGMLKPQNPLETLLIDGTPLEGTVNLDNTAAAGKPKTIYKEDFAKGKNQNLSTKESITSTSQTEYTSIITSDDIYVSSTANRDQTVWTTFDDTLVTEPILFTTKNIGSEINSAASINDLKSESNLEETSTDYNILSNAKQGTTGVSPDMYIVPQTNTIEYNFEADQTTDNGYISPVSHSNSHQIANKLQDQNSTSWSAIIKSRNVTDFVTIPSDSLESVSSTSQNDSILSEDKVITTALSNDFLNNNELISNVSESTKEENILLLQKNTQNKGTENVPNLLVNKTNLNSIVQQGEQNIETETYETTTTDSFSPPMKISVDESQNVFITTNAAGDTSTRAIVYSTSEVKYVSPVTKDNDMSSTTNVDNIITSETVTYQPALVDNIHVLPETVGAQTVMEMHKIFEGLVTSRKSGIPIPTVPLTYLKNTGNADTTTQSYKSVANVEDLAVYTVNDSIYYAEIGDIDRVRDIVNDRRFGDFNSNSQSGTTDEILTSGGVTIPIVEGSTTNFQPGVADDVKPYTPGYFVTDSQSEVTETTSGISTVFLVREPTFNGQTGASYLPNDVTKPYTAGDFSVNSKPEVIDKGSDVNEDVTTNKVPVFNGQPRFINMSNNTDGDHLINLGSGASDATTVAAVPTNGEFTLNKGVDDIFNHDRPYSDGDISIYSQSGPTRTANDDIIDTLIKHPVYNEHGNVHTAEGITIDSLTGVSDTFSVVNALPTHQGSTLNTQTVPARFDDVKDSPRVGDPKIDSQLGVISTASDSTMVSIDGKPVVNIQAGITDSNTDTTDMYTVESHAGVGDAVSVINALPTNEPSTYNTLTSVADKSSEVTITGMVGDIRTNSQSGVTGGSSDSITAPTVEWPSYNSKTVTTKKSIIGTKIKTGQDLTIRSQLEVADADSIINALSAAGGGSTFDTQTIVTDSSNDVPKPYRAGDLTTNSPSEVTDASNSVTDALVERPSFNDPTLVTGKSIVSANVYSQAGQISIINALPVHESSTFNIQSADADSTNPVTKPYRIENLKTNGQVGVTGAPSDIPLDAVYGKPTFNTQRKVPTATDRSVTANVAEGLSTKSYSLVGDTGSVIKSLSGHESLTVNSPSRITNKANDVTYKVEDATKNPQLEVSNTDSQITRIIPGSRLTFKAQNEIPQGSSVIKKDQQADSVIPTVDGTIMPQSEVTGVTSDITKFPKNAQEIDYNSKTVVSDIDYVSKIHTFDDQYINTQSGITVGIRRSTSPVVDKSTLNSQMDVRDTISSVVTKARTVRGPTVNTQTGITNGAKNIKTVNLTVAIADNAQNSLAIDTKVHKIGGPAIETQSKAIEPRLHAKPQGNSTVQSSSSGITMNSTITKDLSYVSQNISLNVNRVPQKQPTTINVQREQSQQSNSIANVTVQTPGATPLKPNQVTANQRINNNPGQQNPNATSSATSYKCVNKIRGRYSDKDDCRKFYICLGTYQPIVGFCPENTVFSDLKKLCTKNMSHCIRENQFKCPSPGRFSDFLNENVYYICVNHKNHLYRFKFQCQKGYILNKTTIKCIETREIESNESASVSDNIALSSSSDSISTSSNSGSISSNQRGSTQSSSSNTSSSKSSNSKSKESPEKPEEKEENEEDDVFQCEKQGKFPVQNDCRRYYLCKKNGKSEYRRKVKKCESGEIFHKKKRKCVDDDSYEC